MDSPNRRLLISCGVLSLVICTCLSLASIGYLGFSFSPQPQAPPQALTTPTLPPQIDPTSLVPTVEPASPSPDEPAPGGQVSPTPIRPSIDSDIIRQMEEIQDQVSELRRIAPTGPVDRHLLTREELRQRLVDDFTEDYSLEDARDDAIVLAAFGLLEQDFNLFAFYLDLYTEQVSGFYDIETKEMYVVQDERFSGVQRLTYAHEFVHALQDQHFDIENGLNYNDEACEEDAERCAAVQALLEGDASLLELQWFSNFATSQDFTDLQEYFQNIESPVFENAPPFIQEDLLFPYQAGQAFVEHLHGQGGWQAVNQAYLDPPVSTKQILHPDRYPDDRPVPVDLPDLVSVLGEGWRELDKGVMGEWYTYLILAHGIDPQIHIDQARARTAAEGWSGDAYAVYYHETSSTTVMVITYLWENETAALDFAQTFRDYATARFDQPVLDQTGRTAWRTDSVFSEFRSNGLETTWILAPDEETAQVIWNVMP
jgi:hypothetical protein